MQQRSGAIHPRLALPEGGASLQQVNDCDSGYDHGWNKYCHIGLARHPDPAAACPGISGPKTEIKSSEY